MLTLTEPITSGIAAYAVCKGFGLARPLEKAALAALCVGLGMLADAQIKRFIIHQHTISQYKVNFLINCTNLLTLPLTLYIGRGLGFKVPDYLQLAGLVNITVNITRGLNRLLKWQGFSQENSRLMSLKSFRNGLGAGLVAYALYRGFSVSQPFEKSGVFAVFVWLSMGYQKI